MQKGYTPQASGLPAYRPAFRPLAPYLGSKSLGYGPQYVGLRKALPLRHGFAAASARPTLSPCFRRGALQVRLLGGSLYGGSSGIGLGFGLLFKLVSKPEGTCIVLACE